MHIPPPLLKVYSLTRYACLVLVFMLVACSKDTATFLTSNSTESSEPFVGEYAPDKPGEIRSAEVDGKTFTYRVVDGLVVIGGDMILGPVEEVEAKIGKAQDSPLSTQAFGATDFLGNYKSWPYGKVYYAYETNLTSAQIANLNRAIEHWQDASMLRFYPRGTGARIVFRKASNSRDCSSGVGYSGRIVYTNLGSDCGLKETIHEIGHAVALNHEHSRCDRDNFVSVYSGRASGQEGNLDKICSSGAQQSSYDPYSIMHYAKWAFSKSYNDCVNRNIDSACTILPKPGSGIDKNRMGESTRLTSRDASGIFVYYRDQSPCKGNPNGCTWRGFDLSGSKGGSYDFTLNSSNRRYMVIQGNQIPVAAGLNRRKPNGSYENLQFRIIAKDGYYKFDSGNLAPGKYQWYVHAENNSNSGSVDMFPID